MSSYFINSHAVVVMVQSAHNDVVYLARAAFLSSIFMVSLKWKPQP